MRCHCVSADILYRTHRDTKYVYIPWSVCIWTSHIILRFLMHVAEGLNYRGFALAPCNVSLYAIAMLSLDHRLVRLTIDMLLHFYMHKWKHSWFRLQVRVQLVLGGLVYTILHCSLWKTDLQLGNKKWWQTNAVKACILHDTRAIWPLPSSSFNLP